MKVHLIMPTIGRDEEVSDFIFSVMHTDDVNLYISEQNSPRILDPEQLRSINSNMNVMHDNSDKKGLSYNRNILLRKISSGKGIIAFPDDDCLYYKDTLRKVESFFESNPKVDVVLGSIYDRKEKIYLFKNWPSKRKNVNKLNFYFLASSITIFVRQPLSIYFDENLGAGTKNGSCEDPDFLYNLLKQDKKIVYDPAIQVWHPAPDLKRIELSKVYSYAKGFGYFAKKEMDFFKLLLLLLLFGKKTSQLLFNNNKFQDKYFSTYFKGLFDGLFGK